MKIVEVIFLAVVFALGVAIAVEQVLFSHGNFSPATGGLVTFLLGLPFARLSDRKAKAGDREQLLVRLLRALTGEEGKSK